jgi:hypothetical protein
MGTTNSPPEGEKQNMKKEFKHGEELRKHWRELQRKYRAKKKLETRTILDENGEPMLFAIFDKKGNPIVAGRIIDMSEIPPIRRRRRKQK